MDDLIELKLRSMETLLTHKLSNKELWGDIDLSEKEYATLCEQLKLFIGSNSAQAALACQHFPVCVTTFLVFLIRSEFNYNFWSPVHQKLSIESNQSSQKLLGQCALDSFRRFGFLYPEEEVSRKYIDPILYEAGLPPQSNLDDLFYILSNDSFYVFDPEAIIDSLLDRRSYVIRKPLLRFLQRFQYDRAIDFLIEAHDAIQCVEQNRSSASRYVDNYREWLQKETKAGRKTYQNKERQARPILFFDFDNRGLCIQLPKVILENEWIDRVTWCICTDSGLEITKEMNVQGDDSKRYTESLIVPVSPSKQFSVSMRDGEGNEKEDVIAGVPESGVLFFNSNGRQIRPDYLPYPYCIMIVSDSVKWSANPSLQSTPLSFPTDTAEYETIMLEPLNGQAKFHLSHEGKEKELTAKPQIEMALQGETLFSLPAKDGLFTRVPELILTADPDAPLSNLVLRFGHCDEEIVLDDYFIEGQARIRPDGTIGQNYGSFCCRLYQNGLFLKQIEFSLVPEIRTNYSWPENQDIGVEAHPEQLWFSKEEKWELSFENQVVYEDDAAYRIDYPASSGTLSGTLFCTEDNVRFSRSFSLPLHPYEVFVVNQAGEPIDTITTGIAKLSLNDLQEEPYWIRIHALSIRIDDNYSLILSSANGVEQVEAIKLQKNGWMSCELSRFCDTLRNCPLPAKLSFACNELGFEHTLAFIRNVLPLRRKPSYNTKGFVVLSVEDSGADLLLNEFGSSVTRELLSQNARLGKKHQSIGYPCGVLPAGLYCLNAEQNTAALFESDYNSSIALEDAQYFLYVRDTSKDDTSSFSAKADTLLEALSLRGSCVISRDIAESDSDSLTSNDCKKLIYLAALTLIEKIDDKRSILCDLMHQISVRRLDGTARIQIIRQLVDWRVSQDLFAFCLNQYCLYLFSPDEGENLAVLSELVEPYAKELSLLMLMKAGAPLQKTLRTERYYSMLGKSAILSLLSVDEEILDSHQIKQEQAAFLAERTGCRIQIQLTSSISGEMEPIQKMIVLNAKEPYLDLSRMPETGEYFYGMRYVDQYVQWHKRNYLKHMEMNENTRKHMEQSQKAYTTSVLHGFLFAKDTYPGAADFEKTLKLRYNKNPANNLSTPIPARYFYLLGIAALLTCIDRPENSAKPHIRAAEQFVASANAVAPEMVRRDLLMAQTYTYLIRKEEQLCR